MEYSDVEIFDGALAVLKVWVDKDNVQYRVDTYLPVHLADVYGTTNADTLLRDNNGDIIFVRTNIGIFVFQHTGRITSDKIINELFIIPRDISEVDKLYISNNVFVDKVVSKAMEVIYG